MLTSQLDRKQSAGLGGVAARHQSALDPISHSLCLDFPNEGKESCRNWGVAACFVFGRSPNWIQLVSCPSSGLSSPLLPIGRGGHRKAMAPVGLSRSEEVPTQTRDRESQPCLYAPAPHGPSRDWVQEQAPPPLHLHPLCSPQLLCGSYDPHLGSAHSHLQLTLCTRNPTLLTCPTQGGTAQVTCTALH